MKAYKATAKMPRSGRGKGIEPNFSAITGGLSSKTYTRPVMEKNY